MSFSSRHLLSRAPNRAKHASMREATAQNTRHSFLDFLFRRLGIFIQKSFGGHNDAIQQKAALRGLSLNDRFRDGIRLADGAEPFESNDPTPRPESHRRDAGANRLAFHQDRARSALSQPATKFRAA